VRRGWRCLERDLKEEDVCDEPPHRVGKKRRLEGCRREAAGETMATSWTVGVLVLMAGGRDGGGGRTADVVLAILHHGIKSKVRVACC
jgi:hypothetical protein